MSEEGTSKTLSDTFYALSDRKRLEIMEILVVGGPKNFEELGDRLGLSKNKGMLGYHLRGLRDAYLVEKVETDYNNKFQYRTTKKGEEIYSSVILFLKLCKDQGIDLK